MYEMEIHFVDGEQSAYVETIREHTGVHYSFLGACYFTFLLVLVYIVGKLVLRFYFKKRKENTKEEEKQTFLSLFIDKTSSHYS